ncbi:gamma-glutamyltransferase family protein [Peribacillus castrilensis]|uniref:gamma-glutamyltransferase family protein n=1 Tax=Bacillaceae TaxID=186817 RepID=UPI0006617DB4|nr:MULTISPECIES: gamma-glutamyltransferase [Bacillaceae]MCP1095902.1 gamma-glutamyltransferase [Bacillaceae bacterium OS4b]MBD8591037.1 gamma-glutamyltransferase [Peribacillus simplex]MCF7624027.1 gamma-glutamyltransferase [Peribacillus frigoritolerans]MCP1154579.1 gamma-glutamyltransferase [Peribacillus frigoritolerans]MCT1387469.1 gamma-glutamyltransferase [Peribacillus frigoritolerans]
MINRMTGKVLISLSLLIYIAGCSKTPPISDTNDPIKSKTEQSYGVSSSNPLAIDVGMDILENGGTAADAAIAVSYVLGVVEPYGSGVGGGGGMLIAPESGEPEFIDYRESSPEDPSSRHDAGIPGLVAGMQVISDKYGSVPMADLLQPAIDLAEDGFEVDESLSSRLEAAQPRISSDATSLFYPDGDAIEPGKTLVQERLAETLKEIQQEGPDGFYKGEIARDIKRESDIDLMDLKRYEVKERKPVQGTFAGYDVFTAPPPFSGITVLEMLKLAEEMNLGDSSSKSAYMKVLGGITDTAYQDRTVHVGDGISHSKAEKLLSPIHLDNLKNKIKSEKWEDKESNGSEEHESTTHFVIMDKNGTVVSTTNTLSNFFGSGDYTNGFFLNDQLKNFRSGLNSQEAYKRSRTFTAPTILKKPGRESIGIGSPGGDRIPQVLMQVLYSYTENEGSLQDIVDRNRFVFDGKKIYTESRLSDETISDLEDSGYEVIQKISPMYYGGVQGLVKNEKNGQISGAGDKRRNGSWKAQH